MEIKFGFTKIASSEFTDWIAKVAITRPIKGIQQHHTWSPNYSNFTGSNHFEVQKAMKDFHVGSRGWNDIGQHFSVFPDGVILTGRNINTTPAGIKGNNTGYICIEHLGNFDTGHDRMTDAQKTAIILLTAGLCKKLKLRLSTDTVVYHHWYDLETGVRNNGGGNNKTCPGTGFFGGNTVEDCKQNFLPLISSKSGIPVTSSRAVFGQKPTFESPEDYLDIDESYPAVPSNQEEN